jgi:hypothetical protein
MAWYPMNDTSGPGARLLSNGLVSALMGFSEDRGDEASTVPDDTA